MFYDTFVQDDRAHYDVVPLGAVFTGIQGVRGFYESIAAALPDLKIEVVVSMTLTVARSGKSSYQEPTKANLRELSLLGTRFASTLPPSTYSTLIQEN